MKKTLRFFFAGILLSTLFISCKKGDTGPAGNANITVINYPQRTISNGGSDFIMNGVTQGMLDSSLILAYYNPVAEVEGSWYQVPGLGSSATYQTRYLTFINGGQATFRLRLTVPGGSGAYTTDVSFRKFRIIIAPANNFLNGRGTQANPDYSNYYDVCRYYNIQP